MKRVACEDVILQTFGLYRGCVFCDFDGENGLMLNTVMVIY